MGRVYQHENGRRHSINLAMMNRHKDKYYNHEIVGEPVLNIAPGEPVPPGFEPNVDKVTQIQERLDGFKVGPLVALEYLLELQDYDSTKEPFYLCILCDKRGDPRTVLTHLASYNHISQYLQKHFPTCYRALAPYMTKQYKRNWQSTLQKLAEAIEKKYGRMRPMPVDKDKFEKDRMHYLQLVCRGRHFHEQMGCTFEELIVHEELTKPFEVDTTGEFKSTSKPAPVSNKKRSPSPPVVAMPKKSKYSQKPSSSSSTPYVRRRSLSSISSVSSSDLSENDSRIRRPRSNRHRSRSPRRHRDKVAPPLQKGYFKQKGDVDLRSSKEEKFDEYRKISKALETDMDKVFKQHEKNPEKHPQYSDEWKKFWNKRYKELQNDGVDVSNYDFKPEWIKYWNKKMIELHQEDMRSKKDALRKRLGLPEEPAPICFRITGKSKFDVKKSSGDSKKLAPMASQPDVDPEVIIIEDKDEESKSSRSRRSRSPWEDNHPPVIGVEPETKRSYSRDRSLSIERSRYVRRRPVSRERRRSISRERRRSKSRDRERRRSLSRDRKRSDSRDRLSRRSRSRSRERERFIEKKREYRESSYERDLRGKERVRVVSDLPWEREKAYRQEYEDYYKPPAVMRTVTSHPVITPAVPPPVIPEEDEDEDINVVSILRLLTALEERLGSLGPKIIDLLAQALAMEKNEANSSENLLDNEINCVLFETVKEKLKGQLLAGFVDVIQERAFKKAIKKTAKLLHLASERKREKERLQPKVAPVTVPGVGAVDKSAIAKQIANALVSQGKTDVSQAELEQLINAVVGMAEASKGIGKPLTTASFLEKFGVLSSQPPAEKTSKLSIDCNFRESNAEPLTPSPGKPSSSTVDMDHLSESDLQTLLQNFKDLSTDEQHGLINYLKKLEKHEPERVERLRKFVNLGSSNNTMKAPPIEEPKKMKIDRESPFSYRLGGVNPAKDDSNKEQKQRETPQKITAKINLDSDEEDYSFDDVVKTVKAKELEKERILVEEAKKKMHDVDLSDAKALISNLMSNINKSNTSSAPSSNLLGLPATNQYNSFDLTKTLNNIPVNLDNLANIVGNVQKLTAANNARRNYENIVPTNFDLSNRSNNLQGIVGPDRRLNDVNMSRMMPNQSSMGMGGSSRNMVQYPSTRFPQQNFSQPSQFQGTGLNALAFDQQPRGAPSRFMGGSNNSRFQGNMPNPFIGNNSNRSGIGGNFNNSGSSSNNSRW